jgi:hypothetical protein
LQSEVIRRQDDFILRLRFYHGGVIHHHYTAGEITLSQEKIRQIMCQMNRELAKAGKRL